MYQPAISVDFLRDFAALSKNLQKRTVKSVEKICKNPSNTNDKNLEKLRYAPHLWTCRVDRNFRILYTVASPALVKLLNVGSHAFIYDHCVSRRSGKQSVEELPDWVAKLSADWLPEEAEFEEVEFEEGELDFCLAELSTDDAAFLDRAWETDRSAKGRAEFDGSETDVFYVLDNPTRLFDLSESLLKALAPFEGMVNDVAVAPGNGEQD